MQAWQMQRGCFLDNSEVAYSVGILLGVPAQNPTAAADVFHATARSLIGQRS